MLHIHYCTYCCHRDVARQAPCSVCVTRTAQRHHSTSSGSLKAALQAEQCQMAGGGQKEYSSATTGDRSALRLASPREQEGLTGLVSLIRVVGRLLPSLTIDWRREDTHRRFARVSRVVTTHALYHVTIVGV